ncbi:MAG: hypothetical protein JST11_26800 [Acidobacteria bacterium]|nr:hypothetical protein [Acidobacteriota bacterium]
MLMRIPAIPLLSLTLAFAQVPPDVQYRHLSTFGSKQGIHPPGFLNAKPLRGALGNSDHPYGLVFPAAVAADLRGRVWIADRGTASVQVFDPAGGSYREIRKLGESLLQQPAGIAADRQGRIFLSDAATGAVFAFDEQGEFDRTMVKPGSGTLAAPSAIALSDDQKTVWVLDPPRGHVVALNREGEVNSTIALPPDLADPSAIAIVDNQVCVLGQRLHRAAIFSPAGLPRGELQWDGIRFPTAFAFDPARRLYFVANPRWMIVQVFDQEGRNLGAFGQLGEGVDQVERIESLYVDPSGKVYVVDSHHGKVLVFEPIAAP